ncbi:MAG: hypothetical protein V4696_05815 [Pseudomonadota bacterium]
MRFNLMSLRPALFAAMYRRRFGSSVPISFKQEPALAVDHLFVGSVDALPPQYLAQLSFGNCVARTDAAATHRLLMARPWSDAEDAALPAVAKAMGNCLSDEKSLRLTRSTARGLVAEAMYHLASGRAAGAVTADAVTTKGR